MTHSHHEHDRKRRPQPDREPAGAWWAMLHRDWRFWVALGLALLAMILYALSMEEAIQPGGAVEEPMPAAPAS